MISRFLEFILLALGIIGLTFLYTENKPQELLSPFVNWPAVQKPKPLERYSLETLKNRVFAGSEIKLEKVIKKEDGYTSYLFTFESDGKNVSGQANIPVRVRDRDREEKFPVIVMLRGYADDQSYYMGLGTRKPAAFFAEHGFITLAPDFLGFGSSDQGSSDILENRFERPVTVLDLLASIKTLDTNSDRVGIWGHSNGGQIAISVLEISQANIPTTLWAPVSKGFPESVLSYIGELDDKGIKVKKAIDDFLQIYDPKLFSIDNYFADISGPIQLHQGLADPLVSEKWSDEFVDKLKSLGKDINYYKYPKNDHNLSRDWDKVVERDLEFFKKYLK